MFRYLIPIFALAIGLGTSKGAKFAPVSTAKQCPALQNVNVDLNRLRGDWFVLEQWSPHLTDTYRCVHERLNLLGAHSVSSNWTALTSDDTSCENRQSHFFFCDLPNPSNVIVLLRNCEYKLTGLETDYDTFLAASLCQEWAVGEVQFVSFIWARRDCLPDKLIEKLRHKINDWGADPSKHYRIDQYECAEWCLASDKEPKCF